MEEVIRCLGCGAVIQHDDKNKAGYAPKDIVHKENILCQRCFQLKHYHKIQSSNKQADDFLSILHTISEKDALIVYIIDLFDFNGSLIQGFPRFFSHHDVLVIANKRDILPKSFNHNRLKQWLQRQLKKEGIRPIDVILTSCKNNFQLDEIMEAIDYYRNHRDVYVVGSTNVGKSSFLNALLKHYSNQNELITTSEFPGTTLDLIKIPFDETSSLYDSPGIVNEHQMAHVINEKDLKYILPQSEIRPMNYQLDANQSIYIGGLARFDFLAGSKMSVTCYYSKRLMIHRCKLENADRLYNRHKTLKPEIASIETISDMEYYQYTLPDRAVDVVISGLGFFRMKQKNAKIKIHVPKTVRVFLRESIV